MTTIIRFQPNGGRKRFCNGVCHNAKGPDCHCICSGTYHGAARDGTLNVRISQHQGELLQKLSSEGEVLQAVIPMF